ncbi:hypothetical protein NVP1049O_46 [Vibrio phage 1.049.O._10N.286.54.B5]|nr:hypothetical protein NVP1049O_46 [Vibrio phage 1.049.O._10N.286.54.B5]AUR84215.1 hypothetical protein NVP1050O_46 [Vibrio phage 1.050.O._10N.286.48.A6]
MARVIFKCTVNGVLSQEFIGNKLVSGICGKIRVGDRSICGAHGNTKCVHKKKEVNDG